MIIGIDTGGTNVDGVVLNEDGVCGTAKVPNTETRASIEAVIEALRESCDRFEISRVVVATTLVVNAAVQDRLPSCTSVLIPGPGLAPDRSFFGTENHVAEGAVDHRGRVTEPLGYDQQPSHDVRAVTAKFSDRNPDLERELAAAFPDDLEALALGNESGAGLTFPERAATTVANARAKPVFSAYERAVEQAIAAAGIDAPVYYLKGDGAMLGSDAMVTTPAHTIRSGSAASALGLVALTDMDAGIAVDIGGTTTDVSRIVEGFPDTEPDVAEGDLETAYAGITATSLPIGGDTLIQSTTDGFELADERIGDAVALGGSQPTLTDALHVLGIFEVGDVEAARAALAALGPAPQTIAEAVLGEFETRVGEAIDELRRDDPTRIAVGGTLAPILGPRLSDSLETVQAAEVPGYADVAGAVGCGVARVSVDTALHIDSHRGIKTVTAVGSERVDSVETGRQFSDQEVRELAATAAQEAALAAGGEPNKPVEIQATDGFSVVERGTVVGQIINARARVAPGIERWFVGEQP
ncbi:hydantoinase/oxoprolinase family protein [Halodesulfurarchaeum sp. HSR-GB]|uniref:hydantoinase/oxoprolinase family protein n=1 Tax=Halodesulfurarchaeum sp. HSR-GB TaxID=3074077 RepID=UPI002865F8D9|nr:hydantoinase/oxoprolinase family protein [Halodesulfurarchaeum sp. HSR-GB]MDR5656949.1 hydantoinase/oxoprolinase family protein [Halodesulfurarchaeum sp. HSR-GB]